MSVNPADLAKAKAVDLVDLIGREVPLRRAGREFKALCPFHQERSPSFFVVPAKGFAKCFGCGWQGDAIAYYRQSRSVDFPTAVAELAGSNLRKVTGHKAAAQVRDEGDHSEQVSKILRESTPCMRDTAAGFYLSTRGLPAEPWGLRAHPSLYCAEANAKLPALVAPLTSSAGEVTAVQRIWCVDRQAWAPEARDARARLSTRKKTLGRMGNAAVRLGPPARWMGLAEGVETALSIPLLFPQVRSVWACCGMSRLGFPPHWREADPPAGRSPRTWLPADPPEDTPVIMAEGRPPSIWLPPECERLTIFGDNGDTAHIVAEWAANFYGQWIETTVAYPTRPEWSDFNDQLLAQVYAR